jgi:hypothetical protein
MAEMLGQIISGSFDKITLRQKASVFLEIGELLVADTDRGKIIFQIYDLLYGSQLSQQNLELVSGLQLEENSNLELMDPELRSYVLASLKPLILIDQFGIKLCKTMPKFFSQVRALQPDDLAFLIKPKHPLFLGNIRSGSKELHIPIYLNSQEIFSHHVLIPAQTGRGKSNLAMCMMLNNLMEPTAGILVLDPHDEYYGRNRPGLKDHPFKENVVYYTSKKPPVGTRTLKINIKMLQPMHFQGVINWSEAQQEALYGFYRRYNLDWIEHIISDEELEGFQEGTLAVLKRRMVSILDIDNTSSGLMSHGIFDVNAGESTIQDIISALEEKKIVVVDTSNISANAELLVGSLLGNEILHKYQYYKSTGELFKKPVVSIVLEEAIRVLGADALEQGSNIFSTIAREGRKFKVGLVAITQLPSMIPREILANIGTKIILGLEMAPERRAIIESAAQDLSEYDKNIASLDKGEAIVTSNFTKFALPIKIPDYNALLQEMQNKAIKEKYASTESFAGMKLK